MIQYLSFDVVSPLRLGFADVEYTSTVLRSAGNLIIFASWRRNVHLCVYSSLAC